MILKAICQSVLTASILFSLSGCNDSDTSNTSSDPDAVTYRVTFEATWSAATHPTNFPASAHFSPLVGATHNSSVVFWEAGEAASAGLKVVAETGGTSTFTSEINAAISAQTAGSLLSGSGISPSPGTSTFDFEISPSQPLVTLVSMVAPSPDWFVGVKGLALFADDTWVDEVVVGLKVYDSGTDDGERFASANAPTSPASTITLLSSNGTDTDFVNGEAVIGNFTFTKISE